MTRTLEAPPPSCPRLTEARGVVGGSERRPGSAIRDGLTPDPWPAAEAFEGAPGSHALGS